MPPLPSSPIALAVAPDAGSELDVELFDLVGFGLRGRDPLPHRLHVQDDVAVVEAVGGQLHIVSTPGHGTAIHATIPDGER